MTAAERRRREMEDLAGSPEDEVPDLSAKAMYQVKQGVPVRWLSQVFGMTDHKVKSRLKDCRPVDVGPHGNPLYMVHEAAAYLVEPKIDLGGFLKTLKDDDLPDDLRLKMWQARKARNRVLIEEGELWHRETVTAKFGEVLLSLREVLQLIPEKVGRVSGITPEQYKTIKTIVDSVQEEMHRTILDFADNDNTPSMLGDQEDEVVL